MTAHHVDRTPARASRRALAVVLAVLALLALAAPAAFATEEQPTGAAEEEAATYDELQQSSSQRAQEFFPDPYEEPSFLQWLSLPTLFGGLAIAGILLAAYLWWQPKFAAERREKQRR
jgi:hypothetical protein